MGETTDGARLENEMERAPFDDEFDSLEEIGKLAACYRFDGRIRVGNFVIQKSERDGKVEIAHKRYKGNTAREANTDD